VIEPTDEMVEAYGRAVWSTPRSKSDAETTRARRRAGLAAVLAIVERDRCMQPRGHAQHVPRQPRPDGRGSSHPHFCVTCSDGEAAGRGCINCRLTGMDQTPWPRCEECRS
jgi:hypothetical protein